MLCSVASNSATSWAIACQAPMSVGYPRQEYWSELPRPPPGNLPDAGSEPPSPVSLEVRADSLPLEPSGKLMVYHISSRILGFPGGASGKEPACQCRKHKRQGFNPWVGKILWRRSWPLQYSYLENPMDRGAWWAAVHRVTKSQI